MYPPVSSDCVFQLCSSFIGRWRSFPKSSLHMEATVQSSRTGTLIASFRLGIVVHTVTRFHSCRAQYRLVMKYLSEMTQEQTLVLYSGHPMGLFPSHADAPRVVVTNGMVVWNYSSRSE